jgi:hypothetical protein
VTAARDLRDKVVGHLARASRKRNGPIEAPQDPTDPVFDGERRAFLRRFVSPLSAATGGYELAPNSTSAKPPEQRRVIRLMPGNRNVFALLGPLATGEPAPGGYKLATMRIEDTRIEIGFARDDKKVAIILTALDSTEGFARAETSSLRMLVSGDAPPAERDAVAARLLVELRARDHGQLWINASDAPAK